MTIRRQLLRRRVALRVSVAAHHCLSSLRQERERGLILARLFFRSKDAAGLRYCQPLKNK